MIPQLVPSHVAAPFVGAGQAVHELVPHDPVEALLEQVLPHRWVPAVHAQLEP
jgi:hypothetical protein